MQVSVSLGWLRVHPRRLRHCVTHEWSCNVLLPGKKKLNLIISLMLVRLEHNFDISIQIGFTREPDNPIY